MSCPQAHSRIAVCDMGMGLGDGATQPKIEVLFLYIMYSIFKTVKKIMICESGVPEKEI